MSSRRTVLGVVAILVAVLVGAELGSAPAPTPAADLVAVTSHPTPRPTPERLASVLPLAGIRIALDPGHQLGAHNFPAEINRLVPAGGFSKPCQTTGTATDRGYPEATVNFQIARLVQSRLQALGATVLLTRNRNSQSLWGPCVDFRGRFGARVRARLTVSLHADGAPARGYGFHVIAPVWRVPWTNDIAAASWRLAKSLRAGFDAAGLHRSTYLAGGTALVRRADLATLNLSDVPAVMIEIGNMRNAADADRMTSAAGRWIYARAVVRGIRRYLGR